MWVDDYRWHYDYVRLAWDIGFSFEKYRYPNLDKNKICLVDIDRIIKERDVASVERYIPIVVQYVLDHEQAEVLDTNFVKLFRVSQLSVEYLLFCKKYLDNTVVLLKKDLSKFKEELKQSRHYIEDLESHLVTLTKNNNLVTAFKCDKCSKAFSSEEYLTSHLKRRHNEESRESVTQNSSETDKLHSEIKELKERLNITEKLLHEKNIKTSIEIQEGKANGIDEIQEKFEKFREQVENDIKMLQIEKNFYEEKYGKLFNLVLSSDKKNISPKHQPREKMTAESPKFQTENTTQTDQPTPKNLQMETIQDKNVYNFTATHPENTENEITINEKIEHKINEFQETINSKISSSLCNIESKMQAFWDKLKEIETSQSKKIEEREQQPVQSQSDPFIPQKPKIKPRSKFSQPTTITDNDSNQEKANKIKMELEQIISKPKTISNASKEEPYLDTEFSSINETSSSQIEPEPEVHKIQILQEGNNEVNKPSMSTLGKRSITSLKNVAQKKEVIDSLREEICNVIHCRLQELGIDPNWTGIPRKTFDRTLEIVEHHANLTKKSYSNFESIKRSIKKSLRNNKTLKIKQGSTLQKKSKQKQNVINIKYKTKRGDVLPNLESKPSVVTIKNRSIYDTDTDSDATQSCKLPVRNVEAAPLYSAVIEELKSLSLQQSKDKTENPDSDNNSNGERIVHHTKSVLKNYPSVSSLTKKKVLFDIEIEKDSEHTTSAHILQDGSVARTNPSKAPVEHKQNLKDNDGSSSDFEVSEMVL